MSWRLAKSLAVLLAEANAVAPHRSKRYDGTIGDAAHQARNSRHNPYRGVVTALDLTHDPANGLDCADLFTFLRTFPHPNLEYIIHGGLVARRRNGWTAERYTGSNPHNSHIHVAVGHGTDGAPFVSLSEVDNTDPWGLEEWKGGDDMTPAQDRMLRECKYSTVKHSFELKILAAQQAGDTTQVAALEARKIRELAALKTALKL